MSDVDLAVGLILIMILLAIAISIALIVLNYKLWSKIVNSINTDSKTLIKIIGFIFCPVLISLIVYVIVRKDA